MAARRSNRRRDSKAPTQSRANAEKQKRYRLRRDLGLEVYELCLDRNVVMQLMIKKNINVTDKKSIENALSVILFNDLG
jgi:hypothetical protein